MNILPVKSEIFGPPWAIANDELQKRPIAPDGSETVIAPRVTKAERLGRSQTDWLRSALPVGSKDFDFHTRAARAGAGLCDWLGLVFDQIERLAGALEFGFDLFDEARGDLQGATFGVLFEFFAKAGHSEGADAAGTAAQAVGGRGECFCVVLSDCGAHFL